MGNFDCKAKRELIRTAIFNYAPLGLWKIYIKKNVLTGKETGMVLLKIVVQCHQMAAFSIAAVSAIWCKGRKHKSEGHFRSWRASVLDAIFNVVYMNISLDAAILPVHLLDETPEP
jgi:hypothetical protein